MTLEYKIRPYRPCVGILLLNSDNHIFAGQRIDNHLEAWQMPQGGIDEGEDVQTACFREMKEEIGTEKARILAIHPDWLNYDIPETLANKLWQRKYRGQTQKWIALRFEGSDLDINIHTQIPEFINWRWVKPSELSSLAAPFKQDVYDSVLNEFSPLFEPN
ncbi:RNA pyrophosphohydrolase [Alphaproteobacteria bacterium]|nr:RNA pyrophosphohydrolase [Alphaproteobacteria bacterium]